MTLAQGSISSVGIGLVLLSAALHGWWNFVLKRVGGEEGVLAVSCVIQAVILFPAIVYHLIRRPHIGGALVLYAACGAALVLSNYRFLSAAYRRVDLSIAYPIARGAVLIFLPVLGWFVFAERLTAAGAAGLLLISAGVLVQAFASSATAKVGGIGFALLAALTTAAYTIWDKLAIRTLPTLAYFGTYTLIVAIFYIIAMRRRHGAGYMVSAWNRERRACIEIGLGNTSSYLLVLAALRTDTSSYVIGLRQMSIALGVLLGWRFLGERVSTVRAAGIAALLAGCLFVMTAGH